MKNKNIIESFNNAIKGILFCLKNERNFKIHCIIGALILILSIILKINRIELLIIILLITLVLTAELFNTAIENCVDLICGEKYEKLAKIAKDSSAGAVAICSLSSAIIGYLILYKKLHDIEINNSFIYSFKNNPVYTNLISLFFVIFIILIIKILTKSKNLLSGGMPSGHSAIAFCLATCISFISAKFIIITLSYTLALMVCQSRIEGKIHTGPQVLVGSFLGFFLTFVIFKLI